MSILSTTSKGKDLIPPECTVRQIKDALRWAEKGGSFDHIREDVPKAAQRWVRNRLNPVEKRFWDWARASKVWSRPESDLALSELDSDLQGWLRERVMSALAGMEYRYESTRETGYTRGISADIEVPKEECQEAYTFIRSKSMPERMSDMPHTLQLDIDDHLEVPCRHLEKEAMSVRFIARGMYPMSRTEKDVDADCLEAVESGLPDFISALKNRLRE